MRKEVGQGLGLLAVAAICGLLALTASDDSQVGAVAGGAALLFALGGLVLVAVGLLRRQDA